MSNSVSYIITEIAGTQQTHFESNLNFSNMFKFHCARYDMVWLGMITLFSKIFIGEGAVEMY